MWQLTPGRACFFVLVVQVLAPLLCSLCSGPPHSLPSSPSPTELSGRNPCLCHPSPSPATLQPPTPASHCLGQQGLPKAEKVGRDGSYCSHVLSAAVANWQQATCSRCPGGQRQARSPPAARNCRPLSAPVGLGRGIFSANSHAPPSQLQFLLPSDPSARV